ncbi:M48 family metallopeptidase [Novosphingobium decolorationis]|uniref:M48 family metalloprotease n=1 Tax=Novosphingobium decolorationis TaxID=2698673 RepID=A0ABX8E3K0_9SPHN|nr:M48 family metallopeptidase [Novosphingobium decolorationis]QVM83717.1 M48 family metalloprotease [Novosphingobium decolorationis]
MEFRLREAATPLCRRTNSATGLVIDYLEAYDPGARAEVAAATGMGDLPQIAGVVPGSPAEKAGVKAGDTLVRLNGTPLKQLIAESADRRLFAEELLDRIAQLPASEMITLDLRRGDSSITATLSPSQSCATRFVLSDSGGLAHTDGTNVAIEADLLRHAANDDELALVAAHELAHIVAGDGKASGLNDRRRMEDRADILGADLARCAGYDAVRALDFWKRYNDKDWLRWLRSPSHRNVPERIRRMHDHLVATPSACPPAIPDKATT